MAHRGPVDRLTQGYAAIAQGFGLAASTFVWADPPPSGDLPEKIVDGAASCAADPDIVPVCRLWKADVPAR